jgi:type II secretory pathway component HofQ
MRPGTTSLPRRWTGGVARRAWTAPLAVLLLLLSLEARGAGGQAARVSLDVREAPVREIAQALVELGGFQLVVDPDVRCALTVKVHEVEWLTAFETTLRACGLGREEEAGVVRVAPLARLREEALAQRRVAETREARAEGKLVLFKLSWARVEEMAPLVKQLVSPRGQVTLDPRTNTLVLTY